METDLRIAIRRLQTGILNQISTWRRDGGQSHIIIGMAASTIVS